MTTGTIEQVPEVTATDAPPDTADGLNPVHTVTTAAERARRHPKTILAALRSKELTGYQRTPSGTWRIFQNDLDAWIRTPVKRRRRRANA